MYFSQSNKLNLGTRNCLLLITVYSRVYASFYLFITVLMIIINIILILNILLLQPNIHTPCYLSYCSLYDIFLCWLISDRNHQNCNILEQNRKMKIFSSIISKLQIFDIFSNPISIRYDSKQSYKTRTSSCISIGLLCFLMFNIYPFISALLNCENINVIEYTSHQENPTAVAINKQNFFFAIGIFGVDMFSQTSKLFEYQFIHYTIKDGVTTRADVITLVQCDQAIFQSTYSDFKDIYAKMNLHRYLCLPDSISMNISGKELGHTEQYLSFKVKGCSSNCASAADVLQFQQLQVEYYINFFFINKLLNPNMIDPISYYFEDKLFSIMSGNLLKKTDFFINQYVIKTEQSLLLPFSDEKVDQGFFININERAQTTLPVTNRTFLEYNLFKSDQKYHVVRSYVTVGDLLSYVGGLFAIYVMLFGCVMTEYNKLGFSLKLYQKIFKDGYDQTHESNVAKQATPTLNFFTFIKYMISQVWPSMHRIKQKIEETENKINVDDFIDRIVSFEKKFKCLLDYEEITLLMLQDKNSINDQKDRRNFILKNNELMSLASLGNVLKNNKTAPCDSNQSEKIKIYQAIRQLEIKMNQGDEKSRKILQGVSQKIYEEYQKYKQENSAESDKRGKQSASQIQKYPDVIPKFKKQLSKIQKKSAFFG